MDLSPAPIWELWQSGGPFIGDMRANVRITAEPDWLLAVNSTAVVRGRGTWWRDDPTTLSEFALATSWMVDSRKRRGARSFQQVRNGEWAYWGPTTGSSPVPPPPAGITRADLAVYIRDYMVTAKAGNPEFQALPAYDGLVDFPDLAGLSSNQITAIGQLNQAAIFGGFPDGLFKPNTVATAAHISNASTRAQQYLSGTTGSGAGRGAIEVPNVKNIAWDRSIDTDVAECTINISNITMKANTNPEQLDLSELGFPGYYTPTRGINPDARARWPNQMPNNWAKVLYPNVILRSYEGYGGLDMTVRAAVSAGHLRQTGTWLIDRVVVGADGGLTIHARDMARLLIEQHALPPLVPEGIYPLRYFRYVTLEPTPAYPNGEQRSGNYFDYADIVYDMLLWAGFLYDVFPVQTLPDLGGGEPPDAGAAGFAQVHGVIERTGAYSDQGLPDDLFDKRPIIDIITEIRGIVGYLFWVDEAGGAHFQSPNWFQPGNFDQDQVHIDFVPDIDEKVNLTGYSMTLSSENLRTQIVITSEAIPPVPPYGSMADAYEAYNDAVSRSTVYEPPESAELGHGMILPAMWRNGAFNDPEEQQLMAELFGMHITFRSRQGSVTMAGNPCITINDQIRVYERVTSEAYLQYVRGVSSNLDNEAGTYTMTLTTHWLGDGDDFPGANYEAVRVAMTKAAT